MADGIKEHLQGDPEVYADPAKYFDQVIEIDLSTLEPHVNGPFTPDLAWPISKFAAAVKENKVGRKELEVGLIGSCTNSSYEDLTRSASSRSRPWTRIEGEERVHHNPGKRTSALSPPSAMGC
jgi:aconitate hydratase